MKIRELKAMQTCYVIELIDFLRAKDFKIEELKPYEDFVEVEPFGIKTVIVCSLIARITAVAVLVLCVAALFNEKLFIPCIILFGIFLFVFGLASHFRHLINDFVFIVLHLVKNESVSLSDLSNDARMYGEVTTDRLNKMIELNMFKDSSLLIENGQVCIKKRRSSKDRSVSQQLSGKQYLEQLEQLKKLDLGKNIKKNIKILEMITKKILKCIEEHPERSGTVKRYFNYYLPMIISLVRRYPELEGEDAKATKSEIKDLLPEANEAFSTLYSRLNQANVLDASSDVAVVRAMLKQDGLTHSNFD